MSLNSATLADLDPAIHQAIEDEKKRQQTHLELMASENFTLPAIMEATGSVLTNKYAEGYPAKRYYGGCEHVDVAESLAIERAKELFGAEHANAQAHSGSQANTAVYFAVLKPGDKILTMSLQDGGHLTHGHPKNCSGFLYQVVNYGVNPETGHIDYDEIATIAQAEKPSRPHPLPVDLDTGGAGQRGVGGNVPELLGLVPAAVSRGAGHRGICFLPSAPGGVAETAAHGRSGPDSLK